jgi:hypothetical protein
MNFYVTMQNVNIIILLKPASTKESLSRVYYYHVVHSMYSIVESQLVKGGAPISLDRRRPKVFVTAPSSYETRQESHRLSYYLLLFTVLSTISIHGTQ